MRSIHGNKKIERCIPVFKKGFVNYCKFVGTSAGDPKTPERSRKEPPIRTPESFTIFLFLSQNARFWNPAAAQLDPKWRPKSPKWRQKRTIFLVWLSPISPTCCQGRLRSDPGHHFGWFSTVFDRWFMDFYLILSQRSCIPGPFLAVYFWLKQDQIRSTEISQDRKIKQDQSNER